MFGINTYAVYDPATRKCAIVDPGMSNAEEEEAITDFVKRNDLEVIHIINTHLHIDHAVGDSFASRHYGAPILAHRDDEFLGARMRMQADMFGIRERVEDVTITGYLEDGEKIKIGEGTLEVLHVPGHSPGGAALYDREDGFVIAGDSLFAGSVGRTDLPGGNASQLLSSVREKLLALPADTVVYPGHGPATSIGREKAHNPFLAR